MKLREIEITNFKSIHNLKTRFDDLTILIGPNNSGKTTILEAIQLLFGVLESVKESIDTSYIYDQDIKEQIFPLWFYNNRDKPIVIRALVEFDEELSVKDMMGVIENECGFKEGVHGLECCITIQSKDNLIEMEIKDLSILGYATKLKKEAVKVSSGGKPTACKIVENYYVHNTRALEAVRRLIKDKIRIIIPATIRSKEMPKYLGSLSYAVRKPVISEELIENIKNAKSDHKWQRNFFRLTQEVEGAESLFERPQERNVLSKIYKYGLGYTSLPFTSYGSGSQTVDAILASLVTAKPGSIVLIEEPEMHQHPTFVKRLAKVLETLPKSSNIQIILTTHSPIFVSTIRSKGRVKIVRKEFISTPTERVPATHIASIDETDYRTLDTLVSEFGVPLTLPFFADVVILVEGGSDKLILEHIIEKLRNEGELKHLPMFHYEIIPFAQAPGGIDAWIGMLRKYRIRVFVILDNDRKGEAYKKKAEQKGLKLEEEVFMHKKEDILCYLPGSDLTKLVKEVLNELFDVESRLEDKSDLRERLDELFKRMMSGKSCKSSFNSIASILFDNILSESEKYIYRDKGLLERYVKMEVARKAIHSNVVDNVPYDIGVILKAIDIRMVEG